MLDIKPIIFVIGNLLCALAAGMFLPFLFDVFDKGTTSSVFGICILITLFFGGTMVLTTAGHPRHLSPKQGFLMISLSWIILCLFAALPFWFFTDRSITFVDAFFEAVSGLTTTGATVFTDLDTLPKSLLVWRAMLQWLGGIGIILMTLSILPLLKVGGMQLLQTELSESEKVLPRISHFASTVGIVYLFLTAFCAFLYWLNGMTSFDSMAHAMTTISTGGYSTHDASIAHFNSIRIQMVGILFMIIGGTPFILYIKVLGGDFKALVRDPQLKLFLFIIAAVTAFLTFYIRWIHPSDFGQDLNQIIQTMFNVICVLTGTGYASQDYQSYGPAAYVIFFILMTVGACAGSTSCGIKLFRFQVIYSIFVSQIKKLLHPHGVFIPHYAGKPLSENVQTSVTSFFFVFAATFAVVATALSATGLDFITSMSGAATALSNVGPGLGEIIGPTGNFEPLKDSSKWILTTAMLVGRLELFTFYVLLLPSFWRR